MGNSEEEKHPKPENSPPPLVEQNNIHVYPDWAASMQAYYGMRVAMQPYMNSAVASPRAPPPYMWGPPQSMIPPYGAPYAAFYAHGGIYPHPGIPVTGTALSMDAPIKSSPTADGGFVKKLKEFDGLAMSIGNGNGDSAEHGTERKLSESEETEGSSDASNGAVRAAKSGNKRGRLGSPTSGESEAQKEGGSEKMVKGILSGDVPVKTVENMDTALALRDHSDLNVSVKSNMSNMPQPPILNEAWLQNEREMKRERRKQSNRESARRSRLRKQAEAEELSVKVQSLMAENANLKSEMTKLKERSKKLKAENAALVDKLKEAQVERADDDSLHRIDDVRLNPVGTVNLLARVNNSDSTDTRNEDDDDSYETTNRSPKAKLHQLLDASPRTDAVAAG